MFGYGKVNAYRALSEWGTLDATTTWGGYRRPDTMYVSGDLTVDIGDTLIINNGVLVRIAPDHEKSGADTARVQIVVKGCLRIGGDGERGGPVIFESFTDSPSAAGDWIGLKFASTSTGNDLTGIVIKHAEVAIETDVSLTLQDVSVDSCVTALHNKASLQLEGAAITNCDSIIMSDDITLTSGDSLTIGGGLTALVEQGDNQLIVQGTIEINGTESDPVVFTSERDPLGTAARGDWDGIYLALNSASNRFEHCVVKYAEVGIENRSLDSLVVSNSRIEECETGIVTYGGTLIENTMITGVTDFGVRVAEGNATLDADTISYSDLYGVWVKPDTSYDYSHATIEDCVIHHNDTYGVFSNSSSSGHSTVSIDGGEYYENYVGVSDAVSGFVTLENARLHHNDNAYWNFWNDDAYLKGCVVDSNTTGIYCYDSDVTIEEDTLLYNTVGVYAYSCDPMIKNFNLIKNNDEAIKCDNYSDAVVESSTVTYNDVGIVALSGSNPDVGHVTGGSSAGFNIIHHNSPYHIENQDTNVVVMAENNMWRLADGPNPDLFYGNVDYTPWLTSPPDLSTPVEELEEEEGEVATEQYPVRYDLSSGYPNPFNPAVRLKFQVPRPGGMIRIVIYDVGGRLVKTVSEGHRAPGEYRVLWDGKDNKGQQVASGVYFVRMRAGSFEKTRKLVMIK